MVKLPTKMSISEMGGSYQHHKVDGFVSSFPAWFWEETHRTHRFWKGMIIAEFTLRMLLMWVENWHSFWHLGCNISLFWQQLFSMFYDFAGCFLFGFTCATWNRRVLQRSDGLGAVSLRKPENRSLKKVIPILETTTFRFYVKFLGRIHQK